MVDFTDSWYDELLKSKVEELGKKRKSIFSLLLQPVGKIEGLIVSFVFLLTIILGYNGYRNYYEQTNQNIDPSNIWYEILRLFFLEGSFRDEIPLNLNIARYLAIIIFAYTGLKAIISIFYSKLILIRLNVISDHIVICGLGETGFELAKEFSTAGFQVVAIELNEEVEGIEFLRTNGVIVIDGNANDYSNLRLMRIHKARYVIISLGEDNLNLKVTALTNKIISDSPPSGKIRGFTHIEDFEIYTKLQETQLLDQLDSEYFDIEFFNLDENRIRMLFLKFRLENTIQRDTNNPNSDGIFSVYIMSDNLFEPIVLSLVRFLQFPENIKLEVILFGKKVQEQFEKLNSKYRNLQDYLDLSYNETNVETFRDGLNLLDSDLNMPNCIFISFNDELKSITTSQVMLRSSRATNLSIPIFMSIQDGDGLLTMLPESDIYKGNSIQDEDLPLIIPFGLTKEVANRSIIIHESLDIVAKSFHNRYLEQILSSQSTIPDSPAFLPWERLSTEYKNTNRYLADHIAIKLRSIGYTISFDNSKYHSFEFSDLELQALGEAEHKRWMVNKIIDGWAYGQTRDDKKKLHPSIVPWTDLSESEKEKDYAMIKEIPKILSLHSFHIIKT